MANPSPLRYPGGKFCMNLTIAALLSENKLQRRPYAEPYAGGCGLALSLLFGGYVSQIHINDLDKGIWSFWYAILNDTEALVDKILTTQVNIETWHQQKEINSESNSNDLITLGFSTFFLNRTNRSGIIQKAGVIGGYAQQGKYKLDCRFNKEALIAKIRRIAKYKKQINLTNLDALEFIDYCEGNIGSNSFLYVDPPYFNKGASLYTNFYEPHDHLKLAERMLEYKNPWLITYDNADEIKQLYKSRRVFEFNLNYYLQIKRKGTEVFIPSKGLKVPASIRNEGKLIKAA